LLVILASPAPAKVDEGFTFVAYGDSRTMIYIPYGKGDEDKIHAELVRTFALILGETVAEGIVKKDVKLTFDSKTGALTGVEMPFLTRSEAARLSFHDGWVIEASVEDVKLLPGVRTVIYRNYGGDWVGRSVANEVESGAAKFIVNAGDFVWWGVQGRTIHDSSYLKHMNRLVLSRRPAPDDIYFGPTAPKGMESNWVQTGEDFFLIF
jgi:hypothetical protein